ncbi:hypothetical protein [Desulfosediminicola ganghwensis]|uniref:hypothetical protein n=1 Tax=Desulfosediminicola ganghwensis TaxID=2569540 RepID=UPI0010AC0EB0|nr:hypothetical protein [Desulfosediminicola ganghwensis]
MSAVLFGVGLAMLTMLSDLTLTPLTVISSQPLYHVMKGIRGDVPMRCLSAYEVLTNDVYSLID